MNVLSPVSVSDVQQPVTECEGPNSTSDLNWEP